MIAVLRFASSLPKHLPDTSPFSQAPSESPADAAARSMEVKLQTARTLVKRLSSASMSSPSAAEAIAEIRLLSKHEPEARAALADAGAVPFLASHLLHQLSGADALEGTQENAAAALLNLSLSVPEAVMSTPGILDALAAALGHPLLAAHHAAATVYSLLSVDAFRPIVGGKRPLVAALVALLRAPESPTRAVKDALKALFALALRPLNRTVLLEAGAAPVLFAMVAKDRRRGVVEDATAVVAQVAGCYESVDAFRRVNGVRLLVELADGVVEGVTGRARDNAVAALLNLVRSGGDKAAGDLREEENVVLILREISGGIEGMSERGRRKAAELLALLDSSRYHSTSEDFEVESWPPPSWSSATDNRE